MIGTFLLPIRLITFFNAVALSFVGVRIILLWYKVSANDSYKHEKAHAVMNMLVRFTARVSCFSFGIYNIKKTIVNVDPSSYPSLNFFPKDESRITLSNHVGFLDILVYSSFELSSFISKKMVS